MPRINLTGGTFPARSKAVAYSRILNLIPEPLPQENGEPVSFAHYLTPGLKSLFHRQGCGRAAYKTSQGEGIFVIGPVVYRLTRENRLIMLGEIGNHSGPVHISDNGVTLFLVDSTTGTGWYCAMGTKRPYTHGFTEYGPLTLMRDEAFYGSHTIAILDTYFLFVNPDTTNWYVSPAEFIDEKTTPFDPLYVASDTTGLSTITAIAVQGQYIWLFGEQQTEIWYNSGAADFPFQRVQGVTVETGCSAPHSVRTVPVTQNLPAGAIIWLGSDRAGNARVYLGSQNQAMPVSNFAVEQKLQSMGDMSGAIGNVYQQDGHVFYLLTLPGQIETYVYDVSTNLWHERCSLDCCGREIQARALFYTNIFGKIMAVDRDNGRIYEVSTAYLDENGTKIKRQRIFQHVLTNGQRAIHRQFMLDMSNAQDMVVYVDWSDDRGKTFCNPLVLKITGNANSWPSLWRLGLTRDRLYRLTWDEPQEAALMGAFLQIDGVAT